MNTPQIMKKAYKDAGRDLGKLKEWQAKFGPAIVKMIEEKGRSIYAIRKALGCSQELVGRAIRVAGRDDLLPKYLKEMLDHGYRGKKVQVPPKLEKKFGPEFWQSLIATGKVGEIMTEALQWVFNQIIYWKNNAADAYKERDRAIEERDKAVQEAAQCQAEMEKARREHNTIVKQRDRLLAEAVSSAMAEPSDFSLNDGHEKDRA
jgi:transposase-like protein